MALLPLASGSEARGFWASTAASSIRRVVRRRSPSSASANSWTVQVVSSTRLLIRRSCVQGVIIGRIQGFHAFSIPQDTRKQKLWVTGSPAWGVCHGPQEQRRRVMTLQEQQPCQAMLVSLGGSREPVLFALNQQRPAHVVFFVSPQSETELQMVIQGLNFRCRFNHIVSPSAEDLGECYRALREQLPIMLAQWGLSEDDLVVDYTGGTKSMSA